MNLDPVRRAIGSIGWGGPEPLGRSPNDVAHLPQTLSGIFKGAASSLLHLTGEAGRLPKSIRGWLERTNPGRIQRRMWASGGHAHIEVRAVHRPGHEDAIGHLERALEALEGVRWARVNSILGRVVVALDSDGPSLSNLVDVIEATEEEYHLSAERFPYDRPEHPGDIEPIRRNAVAMAGDVVGLGVSAFGILLRATPFPAEIASLVSVAEQQPRIRRLLEHHFGVSVTDLGLGFSSAFSQALGQGPLGLVVDLANRANVAGELQARRQAWERREPEIAASVEHAAVGPVSQESRPTSLPSGPVERYADSVAFASLAAAGASLAATRSPRRAAAFFAVSAPKAARLGREAFAAHLGRELARRDVVVLDGGVLRRLDRVDTVLLDEDVLLTRGLEERLDPLAEPLSRAVIRQGLQLVIAGRRAATEGLNAQRTVSGGNGLADSVRKLQDEGRVVLLVSGGRQHSAMATADCAIGVTGRSPAVPWSADLVTRSGLGDAHLLVSSVSVAHRVSVRSAFISLFGSGVGATWSLLGPAQSATRRAAIAVNAAALVAQVAGVLEAEQLARLPAPTLVMPSWHSMDTSSVLRALSTTADGLAFSEVARRQVHRHSEPALPTRFGRAVASELANPLTPVLGVGAVLAGTVGSAVDSALVAGVTGVNAVIGGVQRMRTEASIARLIEISSTTVTVRRSREIREIQREDLVTGDVVELSAGDIVPGDCRIIECSDLEVDESILTGESLPVEKDPVPVRGATIPERTSMLYEGTTIVNGSSLAVVVATGDETEVGRSLSDAPAPPPSGVEARLRTLTAITVPITLASGAALSGLTLLRGRSPRVAIEAGVSLMVAAVPEGLPILATVAQLAAARRMSERGALVRNPRTMEALGRIDLLCFDKTGTLTVGEIELQRVSDGKNDEVVGRLSPGQRNVLAGALRASPIEVAEGAMSHATDRAVVEGAKLAGVGVDEGFGPWELVDELAFEPSRGYHAVAGRTGDRLTVSVKGAPEVVLPRCTTWRGPQGNVAIDRYETQRLECEVERLAGRGLRVLGVAEKAFPVGAGSPAAEISDKDVAGLELLGFCGLADKVRPTAAEAVRTLRCSGVGVVMITGDHPATAAAVARELDIEDGLKLMTGGELDTIDDSILDKAIVDVSLFARVTPSQKVRIVSAYQRIGRIVAMTGDGANDAPAIHRANAGIALGATGSPAAREAADLVVVDDRIETIVDAIIEGRAMWVSVREALAILIGGNLGEVGFTLAATAISGASPLGARQLLLVNLFTDMLPALSIALRPPRRRSAETLLHEGPDASLGAALVRQVGVRATVTAGGALGAWLLARPTGTGRRASTVALATLVGTQLAQTAWVGGRSPIVIGSTLVSAGTMIAMIQTPGLSQLFGCTPLGPIGWGIVVSATVAATGASIVLPSTSRHVTRMTMGRR